VRENETIVQAYFDMLQRELRHEHINKAQRSRALRTELPGRSRGSVEFKHCNISAVLQEAGLRYIRGYEPRGNYQDQLKRVVLHHAAKLGITPAKSPAVT
jgi:hypothetical protein